MAENAIFLPEAPKPSGSSSLSDNTFTKKLNNNSTAGSQSQRHKTIAGSSQLSHIRPNQDSVHKLRDPSRMPHLSVSQLYSQNSGWQDVASSMATGDTEFCYLQSDAADSYKFALRNNYPAGRITKDDFVTMSKHGVMRSSVITGKICCYILVFYSNVYAQPLVCGTCLYNLLLFLVLLAFPQEKVRWCLTKTCF